MPTINISDVDNILLPYQRGGSSKTPPQFDGYINANAYLDFTHGVDPTYTGSINPWVAVLSALNAIRHWESTSDTKYSDYAEKIRDWAVGYLVTDTEFPDVTYLPYNYDNLHHLEPGDQRYYSCLAEAAFVHLMLRFSDCDMELVRTVLNKFFKQHDQFGMFTRYTTGVFAGSGIMWEEICHPAASSMIYNGSQVAGHQIDRIIDFLPSDMTNQAIMLRALEDEHRAFNQATMPKWLFFKVKTDGTMHELVRYDLRHMMPETYPDHETVDNHRLIDYARKIARDYANYCDGLGVTYPQEFLDRINP